MQITKEFMDNQITTEEKFISIEYKTWLEKYKPLEEKNIELEKELQREKAKHLIRVSLYWYALGSYNPKGQDHEIGVIDICGISGGCFTKNDKAFHIATKAVTDLLTTLPGAYRHVFVTRDALNEKKKECELQEATLKLLTEKYEGFHETIIKEMTLLEKERKSLMLPKFFNWICKILGFYHV